MMIGYVIVALFGAIGSTALLLSFGPMEALAIGSFASSLLVLLLATWNSFQVSPRRRAAPRRAVQGSFSQVWSARVISSAGSRG